MSKYIKRIAISLVVIVVALCLTVLFLFRSEIASIQSVKKIDEYGMYQMDYTADYGLEGLLKQGGVSSDSELVNYVIKNLLKGLPIEFNIPDFGCSTFIAKNEEGDIIFGRNYDLNYIPSMVVTTDSKDGYASISVANISVLGYSKDSLPEGFFNSVMTLAAPYALMDGMNEKGLSIGVLLIKDYEITNQTTDKLDLTTTSAMRYILDYAANVDEAIALLENMDMHASANASYHFQIADASGNSAVIEYIDQTLSVIRKEPNEHQALTNFLITPEANGHGKGQDRYETIISKLTETNGVLSEEEAMGVLKSVSQDKATMGTQWSVVYNLTKKTASIVAGMDWENVIEVTLD